MFYRKSKWASYVSQAKEEARLKGIKDWKEYFYNSCFPIDREPPRLIEEQKAIFSMIYQTLSNYVCREVYKKEPFPNSLNIEGLVKAIKALDSKGRGVGNEKL